MKRAILFSFATCLLLGPSTLHAQIQKAAVISIFGNKNLSDDPLDTKLYEALLNDSSFNISGTVNDFEKFIEEKVITGLPFPFMKKEEVVGNQEYKKIDTKKISTDKEGDSKFGVMINPYLPADGYKNISAFPLATDKENIDRCFTIFPEIDAVMIAYIDYNLYDAVGIGGMSSKKVYAYCNIKMYDKSGKKIFKLRERASSKTGVLAVGGFVTDPEKLKPMIYEASEQLLSEVEAKVVKSLKKMAKKLEK